MTWEHHLKKEKKKFVRHHRVPLRVSLISIPPMEMHCCHCLGAEMTFYLVVSSIHNVTSIFIASVPLPTHYSLFYVKKDLVVKQSKLTTGPKKQKMYQNYMVISNVTMYIKNLPITQICLTHTSNSEMIFESCLDGMRCV